MMKKLISLKPLIIVFLFVITVFVVDIIVHNYLLKQRNYEQGYIDAIWDAYLKRPQYMIVESHDEP